ncbi:hypothetical protein [Pseudomonas sp. DSP3-2-2]|uniref:hypothetical protein n=1 Tax=unclassified Pseudomonas TaxID=196821 RepID=UPI003CE91134
MNNIDIESRISESRAFIDSCELGSCKHTALMRDDEKSAQALVINDTIVSLVAGMSAANKAVVKDCMLFASLNADKTFPEGGVQWFNQYKTVMAYCGWTSQSAELSDYKSANSRFTMEQEGLKILSSAITAMALPGPTSLLLLKVAKDAVEVLQSSEKPLRLFENSSKTAKGAKFVIGSAVESQDNELAMALGAMDFATSINVTNVLFWEWNSASVSIKRAENHLILNQRHFEGIAETLREKLTENARKAVLEFDI